MKVNVVLKKCNEETNLDWIMENVQKKMDIKDYTVIPKKKIGIVELDFMKRD